MGLLFSLEVDDVTTGVSSLTFSSFREANTERCEESFHPLDDWTPMDWVAATAGEVGELANLIKKIRRRVPTNASGCFRDVMSAAEKQAIADEIGDVVAYLDLTAASLGISMEKATIDKFNEVTAKVGSNFRL